VASRKRALGKADEEPGSGRGPGRPEPMDATSSARPRRISVVGATGSGKSVLAGRLAERWGLPLYELDTLFWDGQGYPRPADEFAEVVSDLTQRESWVVDGHYRMVRERIWRRSEMIVWLNYPLWVVGIRLLRRYAHKRHAANGRRSGDATRSTGTPGGHPQASARWRDRLARFARTMRERREYGELLRAPRYRTVEVVELGSLRATEEWIRSRGAATNGSH
jgi:hypothetical protein